MMRPILAQNDALAAENRRYFDEHRMTVVNLMASPGAGKTSLILKLLEAFKGQRPLAVIEGDIAGALDAARVEELGVPVVQINTGGGCHLDANMIRAALETGKIPDGALLLIENVGNLVCPASFDLGEARRLLVTSVAEGDDKPYKYTSMFAHAEAVVLNKLDLLEASGFDLSNFRHGLELVNAAAPLWPLSCRTGAGVAEFLTALTAWIE